MGIMEQKNEKETRLLETAFRLFTEKGIKSTSIQEIVDKIFLNKLFLSSTMSSMN